MDEIKLVILGIIALFFIILLIKEMFLRKTRKEFCVICISISLTWLILLVLYWMKLFDNFLIIGLLIGMSVTGVYYFFESKFGKINKRIKIFRLPFVLTLILLAYYILTFENIFKSILIVIGLWILFIFVYLFNSNKKINVFAKKLIECCKKW